MEVFKIQVRWSLGHTGIEGNEEDNRLADLEAKNPSIPMGHAGYPAASGIRSVAKRLLNSARQYWWDVRKTNLSTWYSTSSKVCLRQACAGSIPKPLPQFQHHITMATQRGILQELDQNVRRRPNMTTEERNKAVGMSAGGAAVKEIADHFRRTPQGIRTLLKKHFHSGTTQDKP